jgi:Fusaric acid resistance protein-like
VRRTPTSFLNHLADRVTDRLVASDPGLNRLLTAGRALVAVVTVGALQFGIAQVTHRPALPAMLLGGLVSMQAAFGPHEDRARERLVTAATLLAAGAAGLSVGSLLGRYTFWSLAAFVGVMFVAVAIRRRGPRAFIAGMVAWAGYFFTAFTHASVSQLPSALLVLVTTAALSVVLDATVFRHRNGLRVRLALRSYRLRAQYLVADCARVLGPEPERSRARARLHSRSLRVNEAALLLDGLLASPEALPAGWSASAVRRSVLDTELSLGELSIAARRLADSDDPDAEQVRRRCRAVLATLATWDIEEARRLARGLRDDLGIADWHERGPGDSRVLGRRIATTVVTLCDEVRSFRKDPGAGGPQDIEAAVTLFSGNLPGTGALARSSLTGSDRWIDRHVDLSTRQAFQVAIATSLTIVVGRALDPQRYYWAVIACFVAFTGTFTSAETIVKSANRLLGTLAGLVAATLLVRVTGSTHTGQLAVMGVCVFCGVYLFRVNYALMAFFLTVLMAQLYEILGEFSDKLLVLRVEETLIGAVIGTLVAVLVLPLHTRHLTQAARSAFFSQLAALLDEAARELRGEQPDGQAAGRLEYAARSLDATLQQLLLAARPLAGANRLGLRHSSIVRRLASYSACAFYARRLAGALSTALASGGVSPEVAHALAGCLDRLLEQARALSAGDLPPSVPRLEQAEVDAAHLLVPEGDVRADELVHLVERLAGTLQRLAQDLDVRTVAAPRPGEGPDGGDQPRRREGAESGAAGG